MESEDRDARARWEEAYADAYGPLPPPEVPATGTEESDATELRPGEEPVVTGTLFIMILFLMVIAALWVIVFGYLINR